MDSVTNADKDVVTVLENKLKEKDVIISELENDKFILEEQVDNQTKYFQKEGKTFSLDIRMFVYDCILNNVPTINVPNLIKSFLGRC